LQIVPSTSRQPPRDTAATPIAFVRAICRAYEQRELAPDGALARAQIAPNLLQHDSARITASQMEWLSEAAMRELDDEALGWFSRRLPWGSYGMLARASLGASDLGRAMKRWCRHHGLLTDDIALHLTEADGVATLTLEERCELGPLREFCLVSVLRNAHGLACWFIASRLPLLSAHFPFGRPAHGEVYRALFPGGETHFNSGPARLRFDARYLAQPLRRDEAAMNQMLKRALPLTVRQYHRDRLLVERVRQALQHQPQHSHSAEALAEQLHVSARTLHRQLKEEGATLQSLKDEVRRQVATEALLRTNRPVKQIAQAAGFRNEKSFSRAFRTWTGLGPGEFRQSLKP
jgi:AraC-like DNA-binding protein